MKGLVIALGLLTVSQVWASFKCEENILVNDYNLATHRFSLKKECKTALEQIKTSKHFLYCHGSTLFQTFYGQIHLMNFAADCRNAIKEASEHGGFYCYNGGMYNSFGVQVADYYFRKTCRENLPTF